MQNGPRDPITAGKSPTGKPKMVSANRIFSISGPKSSVTKGSLGKDAGLNIVNK